jgi:hypothetical protein
LPLLHNQPMHLVPRSLDTPVPTRSYPFPPVFFVRSLSVPVCSCPLLSVPCPFLAPSFALPYPPFPAPPSRSFQTYKTFRQQE